MGKGRKKKRTHVELEASDDPKSFVFNLGKTPGSLRELCSDLRRVMEPNTATKLKERASSKMKDYIQVAGPLGVTNLLALSCTENASHLRITRLPQGPTLTLRVHEYSTSRDVQRSMPTVSFSTKMFLNPPLVVLNNFGEERHLKLAGTMLQNMFPTINIAKVRLAECRRVALFDYDEASETIHFRHYYIRCSTAQVSDTVRNLTDGRLKEIPDLSVLTDISQLIDEQMSTTGSMSESKQVRVELVELGPRMSMQVLKVEDGCFSGEVIYHALVAKTADEVEGLRLKAQRARELKAQRKATQEANVKRKKEAAETTTTTPKHQSHGDEGEGEGETSEPPAKKVKYNPLYRPKPKSGDGDKAGSGHGAVTVPKDSPHKGLGDGGRGRGRGRGRGGDSRGGRGGGRGRMGLDRGGSGRGRGGVGRDRGAGGRGGGRGGRGGTGGRGGGRGAGGGRGGGRGGRGGGGRGGGRGGRGRGGGRR